MKELEDVIARFKGTGVLVIGDLMIDEFIWGRVSRISPEAPVPVVDVERITFTPGGAGNVINNIHALGSKVYPSGVIGNDGTGKKLLSDLTSKNIEIDGIVIDENRPTTLKSRVVAHSQQVVRIDREKRENIEEWVCLQILNYARLVIDKIRAIAISDYGKGVINARLLGEVISLGKKNNIPIIVDPKESHFLNYKGITVMTPNHHEAEILVRKKISDEESLIAIGKEILSTINSEAVLITCGEKGMSLFEKNGSITNIPTEAKDVYDITGAGDTVVSVLSLALGSGASMEVAARLANSAAGIVVGKLGTATVTTNELLAKIKKNNEGK